MTNNAKYIEDAVAIAEAILEKNNITQSTKGLTAANTIEVKIAVENNEILQSTTTNAPTKLLETQVLSWEIDVDIETYPTNTLTQCTQTHTVPGRVTTEARIIFIASDEVLAQLQRHYENSVSLKMTLYPLPVNAPTGGVVCSIKGRVVELTYNLSP